MDSSFPLIFLRQEAVAMDARIAAVRPFHLVEATVPAASPSSRTLVVIDRRVSTGQARLRNSLTGFLRRLDEGEWDGPSAQTALTALRIRSNNWLSQVDIFGDALTQRSERDTGLWLAGLEVAANDIIQVDGQPEPPPLLCYLDRGRGGAIRRARTRLPGGDCNPVAIIRIPRERMVGVGVAASLAHEVGHQGAHLLALQDSMAPVLQALQGKGGEEAIAWRLWERWSSEVLADFWAVCRVGVAATLGLISVVSLPSVFVYDVRDDDPHPSPWVRVMLSCAVGEALYPDPQWRRIASMWQGFYPLARAPKGVRSLLEVLARTAPAMARLLIWHRPAGLGGRTLGRALGNPELGVERLRSRVVAVEKDPRHLGGLTPSVALATLGQRRADGTSEGHRESRWLEDLLVTWALQAKVRECPVPDLLHTKTTHMRECG